MIKPVSKDEDILGAEAAYVDMEAELQNYLDTYESTHDYDEYHFDLDGIEHDPYVLISILSVLHEGEWTLGADPGAHGRGRRPQPGSLCAENGAQRLCAPC